MSKTKARPKKAEVVKGKVLSRKQEIEYVRKTTQTDTLKRAYAEVQKAFLQGNAAQLPGSRQPSGSGWTTGANSLITRVTQNLASSFDVAPAELELALAEQGLSWGPPFPPGRPLDPFYGVRRPPRTWDFSVGENVQVTPRWDRISFQTIKALYDQYDVAQICVRHLINDVRSLDFAWEPIPGVKDDVSDDIEEAQLFFESPDKRQPFRNWLAEWLQDILRYDAGTLYIRRNRAGDPLALEVVSGTTMIPLIDFYGRVAADENDDFAPPDGTWDGDTVPSYAQIIEGLPWVWLAQDDVIYQPWNPLPESQYGLAPLEAVMMSANTDLRFQWHFLQFFTEGTLPVGFMEAPPDMSNPEQLNEWQDTWDGFMLGDQSKLRQIRWVPAGAKFTPAKATADKFDELFPLYLMRRTCAAFGVTPNDLGFTESVNRATGDTQVDVQFRVGTKPLLRHVEDVINMFTREHLKLRCRIRFDDGQETEDRVATAQAHAIYIDHGVESPDEVRMELGKPIDKDRPVPRFVNNARTGPIPLISIESITGKTDSDTYGPREDQELIDTTFVAAPGPTPILGSPEATAAAATTAQIQRNMLNSANGKPQGPNAATPAGVEGDPNNPEQTLAPQQTEAAPTPAANPPAPEDTPSAAGQASPDPGTPASKELEEIEARRVTIDSILGRIDKATAGVTATTGIAGSPLDDEDDDEDEDDASKQIQLALNLRRWKTHAKAQLRKGRAPRRFLDIPSTVTDEIFPQLQKAQTRQEVDAAFVEWEKIVSRGDGY